MSIFITFTHAGTSTRKSSPRFCKAERAVEKATMEGVSSKSSRSLSWACKYIYLNCGLWTRCRGMEGWMDAGSPPIDQSIGPTTIHTMYIQTPEWKRRTDLLRRGLHVHSDAGLRCVLA